MYTFRYCGDLTVRLYSEVVNALSNSIETGAGEASNKIFLADAYMKIHLICTLLTIICSTFLWG